MIAIMERIFALLTIVSALLAVTAVIGLVRRRVPIWLHDASLPLAAAIAVVATGGSLYLSEVAGYLPCTLCWYQRIAMYPLVVVLGVAAVRRDRAVAWTAVPIAATGATIAVWHLVIERNPSLAGVCDAAAPCTIRWVEEFGFLTIPGMALVGFLTVIALVLAARSGRVTTDPPDDTRTPS